MQYDSEDVKALQMFVWLRLAAMAPCGSSDTEKQRLGAAMFNELVTEHSDTTHAVWTANTATMAKYLDIVAKSRDDCELVSLVVDCVASQKGIDRDVAARSARVHGIYIEPDARRIRTVNDANNLTTSRPNLNRQNGHG